MVEVLDILHNAEKEYISLPTSEVFFDTAYDFGSGELSDALSFGFAYVEHKDHFVDVILANPAMMKKILISAPDAEIHIEDGYIGRLWTARLKVCDRVLDGHIVFANPDRSTVVEIIISK